MIAHGKIWIILSLSLMVLAACGTVTQFDSKGRMPTDEEAMGLAKQAVTYLMIDLINLQYDHPVILVSKINGQTNG